jgi:hypothetical protein
MDFKYKYLNFVKNTFKKYSEYLKYSLKKLHFKYHNILRKVINISI